MEAQGMCRDLTKNEGKWNGKRMEDERNKNLNLNWAAAHSWSTGSQLSASRPAHFGQPTANRTCSVPFPVACFIAEEFRSAGG